MKTPCRICKERESTITVLHRGNGKDICKPCLEESRKLDREEGLINPTFPVRCVWKRGT